MADPRLFSKRTKINEYIFSVERMLKRYESGLNNPSSFRQPDSAVRVFGSNGEKYFFSEDETKFLIQGIKRALLILDAIQANDEITSDDLNHLYGLKIIKEDKSFPQYVRIKDPEPPKVQKQQ